MGAHYVLRSAKLCAERLFELLNKYAAWTWHLDLECVALKFPLNPKVGFEGLLLIIFLRSPKCQPIGQMRRVCSSETQKQAKRPRSPKTPKPKVTQGDGRWDVRSQASLRQVQAAGPLIGSVGGAGWGGGGGGIAENQNSKHKNAM